MKIYIKALNACVMRRQKINQYNDYFLSNYHQLVEEPNDADIIIIWTCAFRADHKDNSVNKVNEYLEKFSAKVVAAGCLPDISPESLPLPSDRLILINWKDDIEKFDKLFCPKNSLSLYRTVFIEKRLCHNSAKFRAANPAKDATFHDQYIKLLVAEGCNFQCAYCSERLAFPQYRSFTPNELYARCKQMVEQTGVHDVILLADSLGQYGCDINTNLPELIKKLKAIHPELRFALNNFHLKNFIEFKNDMIFFIKNNYLIHINLPIQSGSNRILKAMNRLYTKKMIEDTFGLLHENKFRDFDTHVIIGFPGETDKDFEETLDLLLKFKPKYVLASRYMESEYSYSVKLSDKVDEISVVNRLKIMEEQLFQHGIICNCDGSEISQSRLSKLYSD